MRTAEEFAEVGEALDLKKFPYIGGAAPRTNVVRDVVFTTNESPPECASRFAEEVVGFAWCAVAEAFVMW